MCIASNAHLVHQMHQYMLTHTVHFRNMEVVCTEWRGWTMNITEYEAFTMQFLPPIQIPCSVRGDSPPGPSVVDLRDVDPRDHACSEDVHEYP